MVSSAAGGQDLLPRGSPGPRLFTADVVYHGQRLLGPSLRRSVLHSTCSNTRHPVLSACTAWAYVRGSRPPAGWRRVGIGGYGRFWMVILASASAWVGGL